MATTLRHPGADLAPSRAAQRKQRLLELENEQRIEDAEALKMTEEQRLTLFHSFRSVKFEWSDLDGMRSVRPRYNSPPPPRLHLLQPQTPAPEHPQSAPAPQLHPQPQQTAAFAVLTNASLASFSPDETICVRGTSSPYPHHAHSHQHPHPQAPHGVKPKSKKARSPVKGLFAWSPVSPASVSISASAPVSRASPVPGAPIRVPRPPFASVAGAGDDDDDEEEDEDAWVDEDEELEGEEAENPYGGYARSRDGDGEDEEGGDDTFDESALPTPVPRMWRFPSPPRPAGASPSTASPAFPRTPPALGIEIPRSPAPVYEVEFPLTPTPHSPAASACSFEGEHVGGKRKR
ncbi:hypothetical protein FB451DRAFT_1207869 [Mycena latifolia]|nr:hypothetical protein FB451DRAFT_1207869 [Mycena latifolia]